MSFLTLQRVAGAGVGAPVEQLRHVTHSGGQNSSSTVHLSHVRAARITRVPGKNYLVLCDVPLFSLFATHIKIKVYITCEPSCLALLPS